MEEAAIVSKFYYLERLSINTEKKFVMILDEDLPAGLIANTAAVLAMTIGREVEGIVGPDVLDSAGHPTKELLQCL